MLPPIIYHYFPLPLPYTQTLALQEKLHRLQLQQRSTSSHKDILLFLQHRPVYTAGRRQSESSIHDERVRLTNLGADFVVTSRGGQLTYHGPGQLVGYPLLDLSRTTPPMGIRDYICRLQNTLQTHLLESHGIEPVPSQHTGVFLDSATKVGSIGVQIRHRLTTHGFALNITREPLGWFDQVVACGLDDVKAGCVETAAGKDLDVADEIPRLVDIFGRLFERGMVKMEPDAEGEAGHAIMALEKEASDLQKMAAS